MLNLSLHIHRPMMQVGRELSRQAGRNEGGAEKERERGVNENEKSWEVQGTGGKEGGQ